MYLIKDVWEPTGNTKEEAAPVERPIRTSLGKCALLHQGFVSPPMLLQQRNYNPRHCNCPNKKPNGNMWT